MLSYENAATACGTGWRKLTQPGHSLPAHHHFVGTGPEDDNGHGSHTASTVAGNAHSATLNAPIAALSTEPLSGVAPLEVRFDASGSSDPDGDAITAYIFDYGDGSAPVTQASPDASHTYTAPGVYQARVTVTDESGLSSTNAAVVDIVVQPKEEPQDPVAVLHAAPVFGVVPLHVTFDASQSYDPQGDSITTYSYNFGDGSREKVRGSSTIKHTYNKPGVYEATLIVTGSTGRSSTNTTVVQITVVSRDPR